MRTITTEMKNTLRTAFLFACAITPATAGIAAPAPTYDVFQPHPDFTKTADGSWTIHDPERPRPPRAEPKSPEALADAARAPAGAVLLFKGTDLAAWNVPGPKWHVEDGAMHIRPADDSIQTKDAFGSCRLHLEWSTSPTPTKTGQNRGNSGVFLMSTYEIQVLDTYDNTTYADGMTAAMYGVRPPSVDAQRPSGEWQYYDIWFQRPIFDTAGKMVRPARVTVDVNGIRVHDNAAFDGPSSHQTRRDYVPHPDKLPFKLQYHSEEVSFRNIWILPLPDTDAAPHEAK